MLRRLMCPLTVVICAVVASAPLWAQQTPADDGLSASDEAAVRQEIPATNEQAVDVSESANNFPSDPVERLERAETAFQDADYDLLRPLLLPTVEPNSKFADLADELSARTLLGVGYYFEAQSVTDAAQRRELLDEAQAQFLAILRAEPDHSLNALIYPASVVELFEAVKEEHSEELDRIRAQRDTGSASGASQGLKSVYIERELDHRPYAGNFMPFGVGQFQNGERVQGTLFAGAQVASLALNVTSYAMIEALRSPDGVYDSGPGSAAEQAHQWRVAQYVGLGLFAGFYAWSVIDALNDYKPTDIRIRTLDRPPPELSAGERDGKGPSFRIGLGGLGLSW